MMETVTSTIYIDNAKTGLNSNFKTFIDRNEFTEVTLVTEDEKHFRAHKVIISAL